VEGREEKKAGSEDSTPRRSEKIRARQQIDDEGIKAEALYKYIEGRRYVQEREDGGENCYEVMLAV